MMKPNDKAIEAARAEGKRWQDGLNRPENQIPCWKVLREADDGYDGYDVIAKFNSREERDKALERLRAEAMLTAAYAAQFQSEDYAGLVKELRKVEPDLPGDRTRWYRNPNGPDAADAIEALLAERDALKAELASGRCWIDMRATVLEELAMVRAERDALAARLAPVDDEALVERDALKKAVEAEQSMTNLRLGPFLKKVRQEKQMTLRAVEEATDKEISNAYLSQLESGKIANPSPHVLYALSLVFGVAYETLMERAGYIMPAPNRLAPVEDEELVEIAAYYFTDGSSWSALSERLRNICRRDARNVIAAIRPHIEAAERERCAKIAEEWSTSVFGDSFDEKYVTEICNSIAPNIAAAIRSGSVK